MPAEPLLAVLEAGSDALAGAGIRFALIGGAALAAWGRTRATGDVDILIGLGPEGESPEDRLKRAMNALREAGFAHLERADRRRIGDQTILHFWFPLREQGLSIRLDIIQASGPDSREVLDRAVMRKVDGFSLPVASCEDLVLLKLAAGRPVDLADARDLLAVNRDALDQAYLQSRAARKGLLKELGEASTSS
jgi:hypothetical protein